MALTPLATGATEAVWGKTGKKAYFLGCTAASACGLGVAAAAGAPVRLLTKTPEQLGIANGDDSRILVGVAGVLRSIDSDTGAVTDIAPSEIDPTWVDTRRVLLLQSGPFANAHLATVP
jgi:hypothetical protein